MYKQQKPLNISSGLWALFVTALVLLVTSSANAQDSASHQTSTILPHRDTVETPREANPRPATDSLNRTTEGSSPIGAPEESRRIQMEERDSATKSRDEIPGEFWEHLKAAGERRAELAEKRSAREETLEKKRLELASISSGRSVEMAERAHEKAKSMAFAVANRLSQAITRMETIESRLRVRVKELEARGINVSEVTATLNEANASLADAKKTLTGIDTNIEYVMFSERPTVVWEDARAQLKEVHELIKQAHSLLRQAVATLKNALKDSNQEQRASGATSADQVIEQD